MLFYIWDELDTINSLLMVVCTHKFAYSGYDRYNYAYWLMIIEQTWKQVQHHQKYFNVDNRLAYIILQ